eukprot:gene25883-biopygen11206
MTGAKYFSEGLIELRVEAHHLREAKMVYLKSQFDRSCLGVLWQAISQACHRAPRRHCGPPKGVTFPHSN